MTDPAADTTDVARLRGRYDRERRARLEAEAIAEQGLRDLYQANRSLDARIAERTRELEAAMALAEAANEAKGEFLAHVGHELRTPINGIAGMLELLDRVVTDRRAREWLTSARESTERLERLFDRILLFIEFDTADLSRVAETVSVEAVVDQAADRWRQSCAAAGQLLVVEVATPIDCVVAGSEELGRALDELLDNVVSHASSGAVRITAVADGGFVTFSVDDTGPGMRAAAAVSASEILETGESPATRSGTGAGIGLALVRRIASALGGRSGIDDSEIGGSRVWFAVPALGAGSTRSVFDR